LRHRFRDILRLAVPAVVGTACAIAVGAVGSASADGPPGGGGIFAPAQSAGPAAAATLPSGFQESTVISGLTAPTAVRFASDGRVFVAQKNGLVLEYDSLSDTTPTTVADLRTGVDDYWDRGLLGLALDPSFPTNPYIYVLYTYDAVPGGTAPRWNDACPTPPGPTTDGCVVQGRLARLTISGNTATNEQVLIQGWCQQFPSHSIGDLRFGTDGTLYVSGGEGANFGNADYGQFGGSLSGTPTPANPCGDPPGSVGTKLTAPTAEGGALRSQSPRRAAGEPASLDGAVLRVDPATGAGLATNPQGSSSDANLRRIVAYGFRNPFRFTLRPGTNELWIGDVGWSDWEEVNRDQNPTAALTNYGWPCYEGAGIQPSYQSANLNQCNSLYSGGSTTGTFGTTNLSTVFDTLDANTKGVSKFSAPASGQITKVEGYLSGMGGTTGSQVVKAVVYADSGGVPGALLGTSNAVTINAGAAFSWVPFTFSTPPTVTAGPVWIGYLAGTTSGLTQARLDSAAGVIKYNADTYSDGAANPFGTASQATKANGWAIRATYSTTGGGSTVTAPYYTYNHASAVVSGDNCPTANGSSITGIAFYNGGSYPSSYNGALFFADHTRNCIWVMKAGTNGLPDPNQISVFDTPAANPVDLETGPGGDLFYVDHDGGTIRRIQFFSANQPPVAVATASPTSGPAPLTVNFDGSGSSDPDGNPITYSWDLNGDGVYGDSTVAKPTYTYSTPGTYVVRLKVTDSNGASTISSPITIDAGNTPPVPTIDSPASTVTWKVGDPISFSGHATDDQDGTVPASGLSWTLIIHHCPTPDSCHTHQVQTWTGVASGSFNAPDHDYPCWLELQLTATDSKGLAATTSVRLDPQTVNLTLASSPTGAQLSAGTLSGTAPFTKTAVINSTISLGALSPQTIGGSTYTFSSWSDGGAASHNITAPATATTYTATFTQQTTGTFGATNPGTIVDTLDANTKGVSKYTAPVPGQITKVEGWLSGLGATSGSQVVKAVVYSDSNGVPGSLLATSNAVTMKAKTAFAWVPFTFSTPVTIAAGPVWVGYLAGTTTGLTQFKYDTSAGAVKYNADTYSDGASNPFGTASTATKPNPFSIRVTYTTTGATVRYGHALR
jgi:glucose/arabinose dehydrogenase